jgi:cell division protein FtsQ
MTGQTDLLERAQRQFARRQRSVRRRGRLPWLIGGLFVVLAGAAVWAVYFSSYLAVSTVQVRGVHEVPRSTVLSAARVPVGDQMIRVDTAAIARRIRAITEVADAKVSRAWPDRVVITVTERVPVAVVTDGSRYELVDAGGVEFRTVPKRPADLPVALVTGPRRDVTVRSVVAVSAALPQALRSRVTSITAGSPDSITLRLDHGVKVVWGSSEQSDRKAAVLTALMRRDARVYDVSAPDLPVTQGEKP